MTPVEARFFLRTRHLLLFLLLVPLAACFRHVPVERSGVSSEARLRTHLRQPTDVELSDDLTVRSVVRIDGRLVRWSNDTLVVRSGTLHRTGGRSYDPPASELFWLPVDDLERIEEKRLHPTRTALVAGGVTLGGAVAAGLIFGGEKGGFEEDPEPEPPPQSPRGIVIRLPLPGGR